MRFAAMLLASLVLMLCSMLVLFGAGYWQISLAMDAVCFVMIGMIMEEALKT